MYESVTDMTNSWATARVDAFPSLLPAVPLCLTHTHTQLQCRFDSSNLKWCPGKRPPSHCLLLSLTGTGLYCWCHKVAWDFKGVMGRRMEEEERAAPPADILLRSHYLSASIWTSLNELMQFKTLDICTHISAPPCRPLHDHASVLCIFNSEGGCCRAVPCRTVCGRSELSWAELIVLPICVPHTACNMCL